MKPMDFSCCLKVSKSQLTENGFKDATMEQIYCGIFEYLQVTRLLNIHKYYTTLHRHAQVQEYYVRK